MQQTQVPIPQRLTEELQMTNEMLDQLKQKNPNWEKDAGVIVKAVEKIPSFFQTECKMVVDIIDQQEKRISQLAGEEKSNAEEALQKIKSIIGNPENFWINKLIRFQTKLYPMLQ